MLLSDTHLDTLKRLNAEWGENYSFDVEDNGTLHITFYPYTVSLNFERWVQADGTVIRYDGDTDRDVPAELAPLRGSFSDSGHYNY